MMVESFYMTTSGTGQRQNRDAFLPDPGANVFLIADGGRDRNSGEQASRSAVAAMADTLRQAFRGGQWQWPDFWTADWRDPEKPLHESLLRYAVQHTHECLHELSALNRLLARCRVSLVAALIEGTLCQFAQVGPGNLFLLRQGQLQRLIEDATQRAPLENRAAKLDHIARPAMIENWVGLDIPPLVHQTSLHAMVGDLFLLASDGLTEVMGEADILAQLWDHDRPLRVLGQGLIETVNALRVKDNVTVCLLRVGDNP